MIDYIKSNNKGFRKKDQNTNKYFNSSKNELLIFRDMMNLNTKGFYSSKEFISLNSCPICSKAEAKDFINIDGFLYKKCKKCNHVFLYNQIKEKILIDLYSNSEVDIISRKRKWRIICIKIIRGKTH